MKYDEEEQTNEFKIPEGFGPVFRYPDGKTPVSVENLIELKFEKEPYRLEFGIEGGKFPQLPLKKVGEIWHEGWEIPTRYAIDANNVCWKDNAHGHPLEITSVDSLIGTCEHESDANEIRRILGLEIPMPEWARIAKAQGWTPPEGWTWRK